MKIVVDGYSQFLHVLRMMYGLDLFYWLCCQQIYDGFMGVAAFMVWVLKTRRLKKFHN